MTKTSEASGRQIRLWLGAGILMVLVQILLGGITRLTGSGLSITEWKPLLGALPPLNHADWSHSFAQYQQIAQFKKLNSHFTLADYKGLFFWEWLHREWARVMGLVFIIPFMVFLLQRKFDRHLKWQLTGLFVLGAVQGLAGWLMVQSGLNDTDVAVSHIRLAVHFCLALFLLVYLFWMYLRLQADNEPVYVSRPFRLLTVLTCLVLCLQLIFGAFMAGTHAVLYAPTWPDINGTFFIPSSGITGGFLLRIIYDPLLIQFIHRLLAYLLCVLFLSFFLYARLLPARSELSGPALYPLLLLIIQVSLGIACLFHAGRPNYIWFAVLHQFNGILLLLSVTAIYRRIRTGPHNVSNSL
ncbi:COX15/CtaA family protein [Mucilaginibacter ginsenosidivorans]|uniref:Heme A synthase n=1 Tax=Mucilaginibacter ginsenosidivorans TaxID=398053 RepID=A0A5B8UVB7_9SPHI|nr:COX15/CtaA family protein [Mucilaginibacter ginsenosidivorans]QEC62386.1 heme A synthase [Mucilaginibacter ginsenosidivorans]